MNPSQTLPKVLVVDDEPAVCSFVVDALESRAAHIATAADAISALRAIETGFYDIVLSDICMPGVPGLELLRLADESDWDCAVILMTGKPQIPDLVDSVRRHAYDLLLKPFTVDQLEASITRAYGRLRAARNERSLRGSLDHALRMRARELESLMQNLRASYQNTLSALVVALDAREHETYAHSFRVKAYTAILARELGYPVAAMCQLETAALLHDIGKIAVSDRILLKPGALTDIEFAEMKRHSEAGAQIMSRIDFLRPAADIVRHHHERYDGTGYPCGLKGDAIPLGARIFAVADALDAITSDRCYRKALPFSVAHEEVVRHSGTQFDPRVAEAFTRISESVWLEANHRMTRHSVESFSNAIHRLQASDLSQ